MLRTRETLARLLVFALLACPAGAVRAGDAVLDQVIGLARHDALNADAVDWPVVQQEAQALLGSTPGEAGRTAAIRHVLAALRDHHSSYRPPLGDRAGTTDAAGATHGASGGRATPRIPIAVAETPVGGFGRLSINPWTGNGAEVAGATHVVREALDAALHANRCGLIIDVSANHGGNMWPMMGGIAPLYDDGVLETFEPRAGLPQVVNVHHGALRSGTSVFPVVALPPLAVKPRYIALVMGPRTASSAEILVLGFSGQANVRRFGAPTAGATSANRSFVLDNGGRLALTVSRIRTRTGEVQDGPVQPDVPGAAPLDDAAAWLASQCAR